MIHSDERRTLEDFPEGKLITAKDKCFLGNHYHKIKTEKFILVKGEGKVSLNDDHPSKLRIGEMITVYPTVMHWFSLTPGSVMIGLCSHPYDPTDDYK